MLMGIIVSIYVLQIIYFGYALKCIFNKEFRKEYGKTMVLLGIFMILLTIQLMIFWRVK